MQRRNVPFEENSLFGKTEKENAAFPDILSCRGLRCRCPLIPVDLKEIHLVGREE